MKELKSLKEFQKYKQSQKFILLDFTAKWCGPCRAITPDLEEIEEEYEDVLFLKIDVDKFQEICDEYDVSSMPTFILLKEGEIIGNRVSGADIQQVMLLLKER